MIRSAARWLSVKDMMAHGFSFEMLQDLARTGLLTTNRDTVGETIRLAGRSHHLAHSAATETLGSILRVIHRPALRRRGDARLPKRAQNNAPTRSSKERRPSSASSAPCAFGHAWATGLHLCLAHLNIDLATITGQAAFAWWTMTLVPLVIGYIAAAMAQFMMLHGWPLRPRWIVGTALSPRSPRSVMMRGRWGASMPGPR
jgi:hypothetical protein